MSDVIVEVYFKMPGQEKEQRVKWMNLHPEAAVRKTRRKYPQGTDFRTVTRDTAFQDNKAPPPPEGWDFARFKVKMRKNRFGVLVHDRPEELGTP